MRQKEEKNIGTKVIKTLFLKNLLLPIPIFISMVPLFEHMFTEIQTFHLDINNAYVFHDEQ